MESKVNTYQHSLKYYDDDGTLLSKESYKNGKLHGLRLVFRKDGSVWYSEKYQNGLRHGEKIVYTGLDRDMCTIIPYVKGIQQGKGLLTKKGKILEVRTHKNNQIVKTKIVKSKSSLGEKLLSLIEDLFDVTITIKKNR